MPGPLGPIIIPFGGGLPGKRFGQAIHMPKVWKVWTCNGILMRISRDAMAEPTIEEKERFV